ncbi:MAG: DUF1638 domain-containing protein [Aestuariivita sp.]|nr:DUF1638 domain-containing protein [Aestuariivita sp.]
MTHDGFVFHNHGEILLIACGALAREIIDIKSMNNWSHIDITCLPAILHNHPKKITPLVECAVQKNRSKYKNIYVIYADCGTGGQLKECCDRLGIEMITGPHCYSFFEGNDIFANRHEEIAAFYLTDFLVRQFDAFVWKPLGLDRHPELIETYFAHYEKVVYQAQTHDDKLIEKAQECATRLDLAFEHRFTGYGDLESTLKNWVKC